MKNSKENKQEKITEKPFTGKWIYNKDKGIYVCNVCGNPLFDSKTKFDSGSGWPSFYEAILKSEKSKGVKLKKDNDLGIERIGVICGKCGSHLGHVFNDAPQTPTGMRYCINSIALDFKQEKLKKPLK